MPATHSANLSRAAVWVLLLVAIVYRVFHLPPAAADPIRAALTTLLAAVGFGRDLGGVQHLLGDCGKECGTRQERRILGLARPACVDRERRAFASLHTGSKP
jgi:hypothetical protein